ncbi:MAG: OmpA family protein [Nitrospinales bacterium]
MLNGENIQLVKEQLRIRTRELRKQEEEKIKISEKVKSVLALNQKKMQELKTLLEEKNEALATAQARMETIEVSDTGDDAGTGTRVKEVVVQDPALLAELKELREKDRQLALQVNAASTEKSRLDKEKKLLLKEIKRMRKDPVTTENLKKQIKKLKGELEDLQTRSGESAANLEQLLKEKDEIIASYEKMLYGETEAGQEGMLPSEIIADLKTELKERLEEKKQMVQQIEELTEMAQDLEVRLSMAKETDAAAALAGSGGRSEESRSAQTAEFSAGLEAFLITYSDMITLILVIFVLMYSVSKLDEERLAQALSSFQSKEWRVEHLNVRLSKKEFSMLERVRELVKDNIDPEMLKRGDTRTILKRLPNEELFLPGEATFVDGAEKTIRGAIQEDLKDGVKQVIVEGHTDDVDIKSAKFPSNWELSSARAASVARFIIEKMRFPAKFVMVAGFGKYRPLKPNTSDENRAINRRVEIKILKDVKVLEAEEKARKAKAQAEGKTTPKTATGKSPGKTGPPASSPPKSSYAPRPTGRSSGASK